MYSCVVDYVLVLSVMFVLFLGGDRLVFLLTAGSMHVRTYYCECMFYRQNRRQQKEKKWKMLDL